jgi:hypothetical protein
MANANRLSGLSPVKYLNGAPWTGGGNMYSVDSGYGTALYIGDPVDLSGTSDDYGIQGVVLASAGAASVGVIVAIGINAKGGPYINPTDLTATHAPATKTVDYYALVVDDPNVIFECQEVGTALAAADCGLNANFDFGTPATLSGVGILNSSKNTTNTLNMRLLGLVQRPDNAFGTYAKWLVLINNHRFRTGVAGV